MRIKYNFYNILNNSLRNPLKIYQNININQAEKGYQNINRNQTEKGYLENFRR